MCIIIYKPKGEDLPDYRDLQHCWNVNPDGAGIMFADGNYLRIAKGFMTWIEFEEMLCELVRHFDIKSMPLAIHFRYATHSAVSPACCHPFTLKDDYIPMRQIRQSSSIAFMHNGKLEGLYTDDVTSDSMAFARNVLTPLMSLCDDFLNDDRAKSIIEATAQGSRFLIMDKTGEVRLYGEWYEDNGIYYSNANYGADENEPYDAMGEKIYNAWRTLGEGESDLSAYSMYNECRLCPGMLRCISYKPMCTSHEQAIEMIADYDHVSQEREKAEAAVQAE